MLRLSPKAQSIVSLAADRGVASLIQAGSHTFVAIDHEITSQCTVIFPSFHWFKKGSTLKPNPPKMLRWACFQYLSTITSASPKPMECSGSVVECLTWERGVAGSSPTGRTVLCPWVRYYIPCLVLVQPRKISTWLKNCLGCKESNQTRQICWIYIPQWSVLEKCKSQNMIPIYLNPKFTFSIQIITDACQVCFSA